VFASLAANRKGQGALVTFDAGEFLGSLRTWDSFVTYVVARLGPAIGLSPADFSVIEDSLPARGALAITSPVFAIVLEEARSSRYPLAADPAWLWRNAARGVDPLTGLQPPHMPRRLGLPNFKAGRRYISLAVASDGLGDGRIPLIFDSDWTGLLFWWPGGRTLPIAGGTVAYGALDGLEEVVVYGATYAAVTDRVFWLVAE
jgi:hypothetical protein